MANDKGEDPLLRAGRRAKRATADAIGLGQARAPKETGTADSLVSPQPRLPKGSGIESVLFTPGAGGMPRHIAGRRHEMLVLGRIVQALKRRVAPPHDAVLHGSRGLGKTVALSWLAGAARQAGVRVVDTVANYIATLGDLYAETLARPVPDEYTEAAEDSGRVGARGTHSAATDSQAQRFPGMRQLEWRGLLADACRQQPALMLVDEAHTLDLEVARTLLNTAQFMRRNDMPFALVLAGTPHLKQHLSFAERDDLKRTGAKSSFWERLGEGDLRLGLLSADEAEEALREPLRLRPDGLPYDEAAVQAMAAASDRYPYFLQLWGQQAELQARMGAGRLDLDAVEAARPHVQRMRREFYGGRMEELDQLGLYAAAHQAAPLLAETDATAGRDEVLAAIAEGLDDGGDWDALGALNAMLLLGVLDNEPETRTIRAGIPSFMRHVAKVSPPATNRLLAK